METTLLTYWLPHQLALADFWKHPSSLLAAAADASLPDASALPDHSVCFATSGSTGSASWIVLSKDALLVSAAAVNRHLCVFKSSHWGLALPLHHVGGFGVAARAYQAGCAFSSFGQKWNAPLFHSWLEDNHITHTSLVPTQIHDLVRANLRAPAALSAVVVGGGRMASPLGQAARDLGWPVLASYGMTESASQIATQSPDNRAESYQPAPLPPLDIWQLRTAGDGRLQIAGPALLSGWLREKNDTWSFLPRTDEWFTTNDIATLTPAGLSVLGRADGLVKILGELVSPERIEADLTAISGLPLAVTALPDPRSGHRLVPVFETSCDPSLADALLTRHHASCPGYERLSEPVFIDAIPRTSLGKIPRKELARLADSWTPANLLPVPPFLSLLRKIPCIHAAWVERIPGIAVDADREEAMCRLLPAHQKAVLDLANGSPHQWWRAEQVHGAEVAIIPGTRQIPYADGLPVVPDVDGLVSNQDSSLLSIYVADCGAIWLVDRHTRAIGLLHSGKKGTEANILQRAVDTMAEQYGSNPSDLVAVLSPCIRPPDYEVDFAAEIARQAHRAGIGNFIDSGLNTASDLSRFYSYRKESGKTGRMMALLYRSPVP